MEEYVWKLWMIFGLGAFMGGVIMILVLGCCIVARDADDRPPRAPFSTEAEAGEHKRLLEKHGLEREISVILEDPLGQYYIRNGRRYKFQ